MKKRIIIFIGVVLVLILGIVLIINQLDADVQTILDEEIHEIDLSSITDGTYRGVYQEALAVNAEVEVTIEQGIITAIEIITHHNGQGDAAEVIIIDIIEEQSIVVDDIAGATYSSRVLKLAIIDALEGA